MIGQLILSLSILVVLHELGHFIPAKLFKTKVEKFYLFFDPWFELFKFKKGETEYGIGWLPLGGYVKIAGMIDESMDTEQMKQPPQPWEFRSKPAWQRLIIMLGGVIVNFILGFLIYAMILFVWGEQYLPTQNAKYGIAVDSLGMVLGLQDGDKILQIGDKKLDRFDDRLVKKEIILKDPRSLKIERNGTTMTLPINEDYLSLISSHENKYKSIFGLSHPFHIAEVAPDSPGALAGFEKGDIVIGVNDQATPFFHQASRLLSQNKGKEVSVKIIRNERDTLTKKLRLTEKGTIGVTLLTPDKFFDYETEEYGFFESIPAGVRKGINAIGEQLKAFGQMFAGRLKVQDSLGSVISIGSLFGENWDWYRFWNITALLSLVLAIMNLLPIPALDGGHVVFLLYEIITGRPPSDKFLEYATIFGFIIIMALMIFVFGLDIWKWWTGKL